MSTVSVQAEDVGYTGREERALELYRTRGHLIGSTAANTYEVPSCGMRGRRYTVTYGVGSPVAESCSCKDFEIRGAACKHLLAVGVMHAKRRGGVKEVREISVAAGDPFRVRTPRQPSDAEVLAHELMDHEERQELADRVARLRT